MNKEGIGLYFCCCLITFVLVYLAFVPNSASVITSSQGYQMLVASFLVGWTKITIDFAGQCFLGSPEDEEKSAHKSLIEQQIRTIENDLRKIEIISQKSANREIENLLKFAGKTSLVKLQNKQKNPHIINPNISNNLILLSLALHILKNKSVKFKDKKEFHPNKENILLFTGHNLYAIADAANLYIWQLLKSKQVFGSNFGNEEFIYQLLKSNNGFLEDSTLSEPVKEKILSVIERKPLNSISKDPQNPNHIKITTPQISEEKSPTITFQIPPQKTQIFIQQTNSTQSDQPYLVLPRPEIDNSNYVIEIGKLIERCKVISAQNFIFEPQDKKVTLKIIEPLPAIFAKIFAKNLKKPIVLNRPFSFESASLYEIFTATIQEYHMSDEYYTLTYEQQTQVFEPILEDRALLLELDYFKKWQDVALKNYQQFVDFLNNSNYLRNFAKIGEVRLKGSYLYGDLLALAPVKAQDIDLEIFIPNLFPKGMADEKVIELIKKNLDFEVAEDLIKIKKNLYVQFEFITPNGMKIDLSFYDRNKLPGNDWVFSVDALRLDLTEDLQSKHLIKREDLLSTKPSLSDGFLTQYPRNNVDQILEIIKSEVVQLVNPKARDLVFNVVKKIKNGVVKVEQVKSLYKNNDEFKKAFDENWNSLITNLDNFRNKCENAGISNEFFDNIRQKIMGIPVKSRVMEEVISATSLLVEHSLNNPQL